MSGGMGKKHVRNVRKEDTKNRNTLVLIIIAYLPCTKYCFGHFTCAFLSLTTFLWGEDHYPHFIHAGEVRANLSKFNTHKLHRL